MNVTHPFQFNYSSISHRQWVINEGLRRLQQPQIDQQWLKTWVEQKQKSSSSSSLSSVSLSDYRQRLVQHARLLHKYEHALQESSPTVLTQLKSQIEESSRAVYDAQLVKHIQEEIRHRKAKRARLRRQKEKKHSDPPLPVISAEQPPTGKTFAEKIQDMEKLLKTVERLKSKNPQPHNASSDRATAELADIESICRSKIQEYQTAMAAERPSSEVELFNYLFNNQGHSFYESTHPDAQYFLRAHQNRTNLIRIRHGWDQYCTNQRSTPDNILPSQWHEPQSPCDSNWSRYIFHRDTSMIVNKLIWCLDTFLSMEERHPSPWKWRSLMMLISERRLLSLSPARYK